jgi:hypothetical protein
MQVRGYAATLIAVSTMELMMRSEMNKSDEVDAVECCWANAVFTTAIWSEDF